ncbi:MAG: hypothetical protein KatS3mg096_803 [Candidatus Parcubacteria bacterium]|nr:MAG: hypothetical protein KatS3mg096_803 [Candidatus Parcubacteria bacterium]
MKILGRQLNKKTTMEKHLNNQSHNGSIEQKMIDFLVDRGIDTLEKLEAIFEPHLFAIIPVEILERRDLSANAKLLYAEIVALTRKSGYCIATDEYLGQRLGLERRTIQNLLVDLESKNLIKRETEKGGKGTFRRIYLTNSSGVCINMQGGMHKYAHGVCTNMHTKREIDKIEIDKRIYYKETKNSNSLREKKPEMFLCVTCRRYVPEINVVQISPYEWRCLDCDKKYRLLREKIKELSQSKSLQSDWGYQKYAKIQEEIAQEERKNKRSF